MTGVGTLGLALVGVAIAGVLVTALVTVLPSGLRLRRSALETEALVARYRETINHETWVAREQALERALLLRPYRQMRRVLTHPLTIALLESYSRRRQRAREAAQP